MEIFPPEIWIKWSKIAQRTEKTFRFKWFLELYELELLEFSNETLIEKSGETIESARSKYIFELQKFEWHGYYCKVKRIR